MNASRPTLVDLMRRASDPATAAAGTRALGKAFVARREYDKAVDAYRRATRLEPADPQGLFALAGALGYQGDQEQAIDLMRRGLALRYNVLAATELSKMCRERGNTVAALETIVEVLRRAPDSWHPYVALCDLLIATHTAGEVEARVASLVPTMRSCPMYVGLAHALEATGRYYEAREYLMKALREAPGNPHVQIGAAQVEVIVGNVHRAAQLFDEAMARHPQDLEVVLSYGQFLFRRGRLRELRDHVRSPRPPYKRHGTVRHPDVAPHWDDEQPLDGKTILLECAGGYGDVFQYCRFAALLKERGASVVLEVPPGIVDLVRTMTAADEVVAPYEPCRPFDYQCRAQYPTFFVDWSPHWMHAIVPYLGVEPARRRAWSDRFDRRRLNVGLAWRSTAKQGCDRYTFRSVPLAEFRPLADVPGVTLYGLQVGPGTEEVTADTHAWLAANLEAETKDFRDAAAAIEALDVVVSADSGLAHLAGALRKPCFVLLPRHPDWRWMSGAPESAGGACVWYPSMRLFVQEYPGDWSGPMRRIADSIRRLEFVPSVAGVEAQTTEA